MTTKDFAKIASVLADSIENIDDPCDVIGLVAENFADMLRADNPNFDREKFLEAAGVEEFWENLCPKTAAIIEKGDRLTAEGRRI